MTLVSRLSTLAKRRHIGAQIELLSRAGCHLCVDAETALAAVFGRDNVHIVDITQHSRLEELYVFRIPVVLHDGDVVAEGVIDRDEARRVRHKVARRERSSGRRS